MGTPQNPAGIAAEKGKTGVVSFANAPGSKYAIDLFDAAYDGPFNTQEAEIINLSNQYGYRVAAKLMVQGGPDDVALATVKAPGQFDPDKLVFKTFTGEVWEAKRQAGTMNFLVTIKPGNPNGATTLMALYNSGQGEPELLGKLKVYTYAPVSKDVVLVPVGGASVPGGLAAELADIYQKYGITLNIITEPYPEFTGEITTEGITRLSRYSTSMRALNSQFRLWATQKGTFKNDAQYLFFFKASPSGGGLEGASLLGDMPRGKQFGYLFGNANAQVAAHELGHGIFRLAHTFDSSYGYPENSTSNLMDYKGGRELVKHQWDILHDTGIAWWLDDSEDGQYLVCQTFPPTKPGTEEGQSQAVTGTISTSYGQTTPCSQTYYYHLGDADYPAKWYEEQEYCTKVVRQVLPCFGVIDGKVFVLNTDKRKAMIGQLENFFKNNRVSDDFLKVLKTSHYTDICKQANNYLSGSGQVNLDFYELDLLVAIDGLKVTAELLKYCTGRIFSNLGVFASRSAAGGFSLLEKDGGNRIGSYTDGVLSQAKFIDDGGQVVGSTGEILLEEGGSRSKVTLQIIKKDGAVGFRKVATGGSYADNLARYKQLFSDGKIAELFSELKKTTAFPKMGATRVRNIADLETEYHAKYGVNATNFPYSATNPVTDFELAETGYFVRVYSGGSTNSSWIFRIEDLRAYGGVDEIVEKLALPGKPTKVGLVELPSGVKLRKSIAGPQNWTNGTTPQGGGIQYEIIGLTNDSWFEPLFDNINDFFK